MQTTTIEHLSGIKKQLHQHCLDLILQRMETAREAMEAAAEAANEETKSSAGDKYETGRAMMQLEQEKNKVQLLKAIELKNTLTALNPEKVCSVAEAGSIVMTDNGIYYLGVGLGKIMLEGKTYFAVSLDAPIGQALRGKKAGDRVQFLHNTLVIGEIA